MRSQLAEIACNCLQSGPAALEGPALALAEGVWFVVAGCIVAAGAGNGPAVALAEGKRGIAALACLRPAGSRLGQAWLACVYCLSCLGGLGRLGCLRLACRLGRGRSRRSGLGLDRSLGRALIGSPGLGAGGASGFWCLGKMSRQA